MVIDSFTNEKLVYHWSNDDKYYHEINGFVWRDLLSSIKEKHNDISEENIQDYIVEYFKDIAKEMEVFE